MLLEDKDDIRRKRHSEPEFFVFEEVLGRRLKPFLSELTTINAGVMVYYICTERNAAIADIIASSTEGLMKPGALRYGRDASLDFSWGEQPAVTLRMELLHTKLTTVFNIVFHGKFVGIDIVDIDYLDGPPEGPERLSLFTTALADAEIQRH